MFPNWLTPKKKKPHLSEERGQENTSNQETPNRARDGGGGGDTALLKADDGDERRDSGASKDSASDSFKSTKANEEELASKPIIGVERMIAKSSN
jgi:hypothetical protein